MNSMITQLMAYLSAHPTTGVIGIVSLGLGAYWLYSNRSSIPLPQWLTGGGAAAVPTRMQVIQWLDGSLTYFENIGCEEGAAAIKTAAVHAFEHPPKPSSTAGSNSQAATSPHVTAPVVYTQG